MQNYCFSLLLRNLLITLFVSSCIIVNVEAKPKKSGILLDANGQPLSMETLQLLTSAKKRIPSLSSTTRAPVRKSSGARRRLVSNKSQKKQPNIVLPKPPASTPELELKLLDDLKAGRVKQVEYALKKGVKPRYRDHNGITPLRIAVTRGWASMVVKLIESGADIHENGRQGLTLLHIASSRGLLDMAKVLVKHGIHPSTKTKTGWTPLHVAARYGHWQLVQYFLQLGVDPNGKNKEGRTALGIALVMRHQGIIKILTPVTSERSIDRQRMDNLRDLRASNERKRRSKLEQLKDFRRMRRNLKEKKKR